VNKYLYNKNIDCHNYIIKIHHFDPILIYFPQSPILHYNFLLRLLHFDKACLNQKFCGCMFSLLTAHYIQEIEVELKSNNPIGTTT